eukprot:Sro185_g080310.1 mitochondrial transcription termination (525) ;mRNA; r:39334-40908
MGADDLLNQALSSQVSYFYLQKQLNFSEETMWKITVNAPSALGMTAQTIEAKVECLKSALGLDTLQEIEAIVSRQPTLLHLSVHRNLAPTLQWIQSSLEMSRTELKQLILAEPVLLTLSVQTNLQHKLNFFTDPQKGLGFSIPECRKLLLAEPRLWSSAGVKTGLIPKAKFFLDELELPKDQLRKAIAKNPRILLYSLQDNLAPKLINFFIMTLHMDPATHVAKLVTTYPQFLDYNLERHILPITRFFLTELDISAPEFRSILLKFPRLITYSLSKIKHNVGFLRYQMGFDADGVRRVLYQAPQVLGLDAEQNLTPKVIFLQRAILGYSSCQTESDAQEDPDRAMKMTRKVILGLPTILNLSVEKNLAPKLDYLRTMLASEASVLQQQQQEEDQQTTSIYNPLQQLVQETLLRMPALLGYSLEKRIRPRMQRILDAGLPPSSITIGISMTEANFQKWLEGRRQAKAKRAIVLWNDNNNNASKEEQTLPYNNRPLPMLPAAREDQDHRSGRIVHWTRERRPWRAD